MRRLPWTIVKIVVFALLLAWVASVPGRVQINWDAWRFETTPGALFVLLLLISVLLGLLYALVHRVVFFPKSVGIWRRGRRRNAGYRALLEVIAEPSSERALERALEARKFLEGDPLSTLIAAQTAEATGQSKQAEKLYEALGEGQTQRQSMRFTAFLGLARLARGEGNFPRADEYIARAQALKPDAPRVLVERLELARAGGSSGEALKVLDMLRRKGAGEREEGVVSSFSKYEAKLRLETMREAVREGDAIKALREAQLAYRADSFSALLPYLERLAEGGTADRSRGMRIVRSNWDERRSRALAEVCFRLAEANTAVKKARIFQDFVVKDAHILTRLILVEILLDAKIWARAKEILGDCEAQVSGARLGDRDFYYRLQARLAKDAYNDVQEQQQWLAKLAENI